LPETFQMEFVLQHTDLKSDDVIAVQRADPRGILKLFCFMTQFSPSMRVEGELLNMGVMRRLCASRWLLCGKRLATAKFLKVVVDGKVFWADGGAYKCVFKDDRLSVVEHAATGDARDVPADMCVNKKWALIDNHMDIQAHFALSGCGSVKLCSFFSKDPPEGPWRVRHFTGVKDSCFVRFLEQERAAYYAERERLQGGGVSNQLEAAVKAVQSEKKKGCLEKAKAAAKAALARQRSMRQAESRDRAPGGAEP